MILLTQQFEKRLTNEYFAEHFIDKHVQRRVALGPTQVPIVNKMMNVITRWADAIVFEPRLITIIEFKMEPKGDAIGQLNLYAQEFGKSLAYQQYWDRPVLKLLVTTRIDDGVQEQANEHGIEYQVFRPDWVKFWERQRRRL
ncbi:hypothetical protein LCGC14_0900770 [marine sediment metagenome]|uniref:GxxExxY protein n=1 Tax=marine sediment metagenome TaxID=412755 RepID=A0A0F9PH91_9ZZZZ